MASEQAANKQTAIKTKAHGVHKVGDAKSGHRHVALIQAKYGVKLTLKDGSPQVTLGLPTSTGDSCILTQNGAIQS